MLPEKKWALYRRMYILGIFVISIATNFMIASVAEFEFKKVIGFITIGIVMVAFFVFLIENLRLENGYRIEKYYNYKRIFIFFTGWSLLEIVFLIIPDYTRPVMLLGIMGTLILNTSVGFLINTYFATMLILADHGTIELYLLYTLMGVIGCLLTDYLKNKNSFVWASVSLVSSNMCLTILFEYLANKEYASVYIFQSLVAGLFTVVAIQMIMPYINLFVEEGLYRRLYKICNADNILIQQLREYSPVEYQHTLSVARISGEAAELIGADMVLAKVGGLYHRIGIIEGDDYIQESVKLAVEYDFPMELIQLLYEYSGRYRLPNSLEAAIVMIVDAVLVNFIKTQNDIMSGRTSREIVVQQTFNELLAKGLLDESGITFKMYMDLKEMFSRK